MSGAAIYAVAVLTAVVALFASDRVRLDVAALLGLLALAVGGVLDPGDALAGFADPLTIMIAGLFVVGAGLVRTGVADGLGRVLERIAGRDPLRLLIATMGLSALLSAFLSSTGTVAVLLPVVLAIARRAALPASALLMPLAVGSLLGGMLTLIGTPPNLVVAQELASRGLEPFGFFAFTPIGLAMLALGVAYMLLVGRHLLPRRGADREIAVPTLRELAAGYAVPERLHRVELPPGSPWVDRTIAECDVRARTGATVLAVESETVDAATRRAVWRSRRAEPSTRLGANDAIYVYATRVSLERLLRASHGRLDDEPELALPEPLMMIEALVPPRSDLVGQRLRDTRLQSAHRVTVLSAKRGGALLETAPQDGAWPPHDADPTSTSSRATDAGPRLQTGDALLLVGSAAALRRLFAVPGFLLVATAPQEWERAERPSRRAPLAIAVLLGLLAVMAFGWLPNAIAVLLAAVAMVVGGCLRMEDAYREIHWETVVLIAAVLPMATALEATGAIGAGVDALVGALGGAGPRTVMAALFLVTSLLSQVISNTATTVLLAPVAFGAAAALGVSPTALLMTVAIAASTAFATPIASPVNALVMTPGGYRFRDYLRVGLPMIGLMLVATLLVVPWLFPLR